MSSPLPFRELSAISEREQVPSRDSTLPVRANAPNTESANCSLTIQRTAVSSQIGTERSEKGLAVSDYRSQLPRGDAPLPGAGAGETWLGPLTRCWLSLGHQFPICARESAEVFEVSELEAKKARCWERNPDSPVINLLPV